jgi:4a-hydroxytetrahydrobiopterin dehydratase
MTKAKPTVLSEQEIVKRMPELPGWSYGNNKLSKDYEFKAFVDAIEFMYGLASFFEQVDHHADMHVRHKKILFELQRFDLGGKVTDLDFMVAKEIEERYRAYNVL